MSAQRRPSEDSTAWARAGAANADESSTAVTAAAAFGVALQRIHVSFFQMYSSGPCLCAESHFRLNQNCTASMSTAISRHAVAPVSS